MKRNACGGARGAGGLVLYTGVAGFAGNPTPASGKSAVSDCAKTVVLADLTTLSSEARTEATALNAETTAALAEIAAEANSNVDEAVAESTDEDGAKDAAALNARSLSPVPLRTRPATARNRAVQAAASSSWSGVYSQGSR